MRTVLQIVAIYLLYSVGLLIVERLLALLGPVILFIGLLYMLTAESG